VQIGVTSAGAPDLDQDLTSTRLGHWHLAELGRLLRSDELECLQRCSSVSDALEIDE
jgi:hypothetical protein